ncbi:hypothetical protein [Parapedobacter soli]|uniref:hypothetical protein n=1 Tax=Parapedobacter soli TaxID=416955 RepID=UPI0021C5AA90|nr:hypothetical protein [Parapedobacter soli]
MKKFTNIGLSAIVAFAMMFATTVVVAQEKVVASDNVEVKASVDAKLITVTHEQLKADLEPTQGKILTDQRWFPVLANPSSPNDPKAATITGSPNATLPSPSECNTPFSGPICSAQVDVEGIDDTELATILSNISNNTQTYTVQDLIDAGASTTVSAAREFDPDID